MEGLVGGSSIAGPAVIEKTRCCSLQRDACSATIFELSNIAKNQYALRRISERKEFGGPCRSNVIDIWDHDDEPASCSEG